jgi:enamine deaminase RidA (YjgF/YER057c/UK114 family)
MTRFTMTMLIGILLTGCGSMSGPRSEPLVIGYQNPETMVDPSRMGYSHIVTARNGTLVFIAGQGPTNAEGKPVGRGDLKAQANQAVDNILAALAALDAGAENILYLRINVVGYQPKMLMDIAPALKRLQTSGDMPPASVFIGVESLIVPGTLIEIETIAAI